MDRMLWIGLALLIVAVLLVITCCSYLTANIHVRREGKNDRIDIRIKALYGLVRLHYNIPIFRFASGSLEMRTEQFDPKRGNKKQESKRTMTMTDFMNAMNRWQQLREHTLSLGRWIKQTLSHVKCEQLEWGTRIGLGDAAYTAVCAGALWSIKTSLIGWSSALLHYAETPKLEVTPLYNDHHFSTAGTCILKIRIGYAIYAGLLLLVRILRVKGGVKLWKITLLKAS